MALSLDSISKGRAAKAPRILLIGVEGIGKSTAAAQSDNPIFLPMKGEQGVDQIDCHKFPVASSFGDVLEAIGVLYNNKHDYKTFVIDSTTALEPLIWDEVCKLHNETSIELVLKGFGKGYIEALKFWRELTTGLDALRDDKGIGCVLTGHVKTKEFNDPEADPYTTYMFDLQEKASSHLMKWADAMFFCNYERAIVERTEGGFNKTTSRSVTNEQAKRYLYTEKRPAHPGKNRYGLPYKLPLDFSAVLTAIAAANTTTTEE